jgi:endonuclease/exonuclease/phosphatase family metal-dependent hydrolase
MRILIQNLQKRDGLATELFNKHDPDVMLCQEINLPSESCHFQQANNVSSMGFGTAIAIGSKLVNTNANLSTRTIRVQSPYAEFGGLIHKKTTVTCIIVNSIPVQFVSFHGYNGQPFKNVSKLVAHVEAVLAKMKTHPCGDDDDNNDDSGNSDNNNDNAGPAVFAGDFNTWSQEHLDQCKQILQNAGFHLAYSWPYPGREQKTPLDHVFVRDLELKKSEYFTCLSDHKGAIVELDLNLH